MKSMNQWFRKIHRWLTIPVVAVVIFSMVMQGEPIAATSQRIQQIMILGMIITGSYLYLLPYISKWQRARRRARTSQATKRQANRQAHTAS